MESYRNNLGYLINKAAKLSKWHLSAKLDQYGLTAMQWAVLKDLSMHESADMQSRTPASIAERLHADRPTMSGVIERLSKKGLVSGAPNPVDRRSQIIDLTEEARRLLPLLEDAAEETVRQFIKGFEWEELGALQDYLNRIIQNLSE